MPVGLILRFAGHGRADYNAVNAKLNIDPNSGAGDWPPGLLCHAAGSDGDALVVMEVWDSREAQGRFMETRLGRAVQETGITAAPDLTWIDLFSYHTPGSAAKT
jgi:hypothetical protein